MARLRILLDENMNDRIGEVVARHGHLETNSRDLLSPQAVDEVIWMAAIDENVVIVSFDRDFRAIATQFPSGQRGALKRRAGLISLSGVHEPTAAGRVATLMTEIEFAHERAVERRLRFIMSITATSWTVVDNAALRPEHERAGARASVKRRRFPGSKATSSGRWCWSSRGRTGRSRRRWRTWVGSSSRTIT